VVPPSSRCSRRQFHRWGIAAITTITSIGLQGCTAFDTPSGPHKPVEGEPTSGGEIAQSDINRIATLGMRDNFASLIRLADKLYRRNPAEWRKTNAASREDALGQIRAAIEARLPWNDLKGQRDIKALALALDPSFSGDRVAAFIVANADMLVTAHGGKTSFYLLDSLDAQHLHNAARNMETAAWMLANRRNAAGQPLLLADEINAQDRNLSFEREFGKIIGRLDLLAAAVTEKYRRAVITYVQNMVGGVFLQFLPVR
jgi:hypothetical protein